MKPSIPKGTRDFGPVEMAKRNYIFNTIRSVYELYGFQQIETPAQETLATLMGKYGEEGDKLLFKILNSGDYLNKIDDQELTERNTLRLASKICEKGLRYDLTVPFARYVVMHREELQLPFKRYQVQPVWRADRPQKGRYREFYQFDGDVVGSDSLLNEVELMQIVDTVFTRFGVRVQIKINNRKILTGIAEVIGAADKIVDITVAIDKLDKIGIDNVNQELREDGLSEEQIQKLQPIIMLEGTNEEEYMTHSEFEVKEQEQIRVIVCRPMEKAEVIEINDDLRSMQETVGGMIEEYTPFYDENDPRVEDVAIICDDEGKMKRRQMNRAIQDENGKVLDIIAGPFFICYAPIESEKFLSLPKDLEEKFRKKFELPEMFFQGKDGIFAEKYEPGPASKLKDQER